MKKIGKIYFIIVFVFFIIFMSGVIQTFKPVRDVQPDEVIKISGKAVNIQEGANFDIVIALENDTHYYYINQGLQYNLTLEQLRSEILNKTVTLYSVNRWTFFTRDGIMGHISKLMIDDKVLFNEINDDTHEKTIKL